MRLKRLPLPMLALLLAACGSSTDSEPPLRVDAVGIGTRQAIIADSTGKGLTARDAQGRIIPGLAQSWRVSDDGLSIVFRLRDARFADGSPVLAASVVATLNRARGPRGPAMTRALMGGVSGISSPLEDVIEVRLTTPQPEILELFATSALAIQAKAGAGPFVVVPAETPPQAGESATVSLASSESFFAASAVQIARITVSDETPEAAIARFNRGDTDIVTGGALEGFGSARVLARRDTLKLEQQRGALTLLVNQKSGALKDRRVRTALAMAVDRVALGAAVFGSADATAVPGLTPRSLSGYTQGPIPDWDAWPMVQRLEEARRLLAESGHDALTNRLKLQLAVPDSPEAERLVSDFADEWAGIGVDVVLQRRTADFHAKAVKQGDFEIALVSRIATIDSPLPFLLPFACNANRHGVCLREADRLVASAWKAATLTDRMVALAAAERLWAEDGAAIGLVQPLGWSLVSPRIAGWTPNPSGVHPLSPLQRKPDRKLIK